MGLVVGGLVVGRSPGLTAALAAGHLAALAAVWIALPLPAALVLSGALGWSAHGAIGRHGLRVASDAVVGIAFEGSAVRLTRRDGSCEAGTLRGDSLVSPALVIVRLAAGPWRLARSVAIPRDCVSAEDHRRLRVLLRWGPGPGAKQRRSLQNGGRY